MYIDLTKKKKISKKEICDNVKKYGEKEFIDLYITLKQRKEIDKMFKSSSWSENVKKVDISKTDYQNVFIKIKITDKETKDLKFKEVRINIGDLNEKVQILEKIVYRYIISKEIQKHCKSSFEIESDGLDEIMNSCFPRKFK